MKTAEYAFLTFVVALIAVLAVVIAIGPIAHAIADSSHTFELVR